jgi:hypothetical protein
MDVGQGVVVVVVVVVVMGEILVEMVVGGEVGEDGEGG